jgi:hypothetical protein
MENIVKEIEAHKEKLKVMELEYQRVLGSLQALEYVAKTLAEANSSDKDSKLPEEAQ